MGFLDWIKTNPVRQMHNDAGAGWKTVGIYFYRADGRYSAASWAQTPQQFEKMFPRIREHLNRKLEVRIVDTQDRLLFHATDKGIEWDGSGLAPLLKHERKNTSLDRFRHGVQRDGFPDR
jgi:hypothetical protein